MPNRASIDHICRTIAIPFGNQPAMTLQQLRDLTDRLAILQGLAVSHQRALGGLALHGVEVVERAFHQLEAFQVSVDCKLIGFVRVAGTIAARAVLERGDCKCDR